MKVNYDIIKKFGKKAGFDKLMDEPKFLRMLTNYTEMVLKKDEHVEDSFVKIEMKCMVDHALVTYDELVSKHTIKTMPEELLCYYYGRIALRFREENKIV